MVGETQPLIKKMRAAIPTSPWATALTSSRDATRYIPQAIAHRGFKAKYPENSMAGFKAAVDVGAHAIETDLHLSKDGVVVLTHDGDLKRTFGVDKKVNEVDWDELSTLKSLREPSQGLPRLVDLLQWLAEPGLEKTWVLLDIKIDDKAEVLLSALSNVLAEVPSTVPWEKRIVLGCWNATFLETARRILPTYPLAVITVSTTYARHFLPTTNVGFNMLQQSLLGPIGRWFLRDARAAGRPVFAWTVNEESKMRWCLERNLDSTKAKTKAGTAVQGVRSIDGVITDDPALFLDVCRRWEDELDGKVKPGRKGVVQSVGAWLKHLRDVLVFQSLITLAYVLQVHIKGRMDFIKDRESLEASPEEAK